VQNENNEMQPDHSMRVVVQVQTCTHYVRVVHWAN